MDVVPKHTDEMFTESFYNFGLKLLNDIASDGQTVVFSPTSILLSLGTLFNGTEGQTKEQLRRAMISMETTDDDFLRELKQVEMAVNKSSKEFVQCMSKWLYCSLEYKILDAFKEATEQTCKSNLVSVDFTANTEELRQEINVLVKDETNKKIRDILSVGLVTKESKLICVNAEYFQQFWGNYNITKDRPFHPNSTTKIKVDMVTIVGDELKYTNNDKCKVLGIPYKESDVVMFFILPNEETDLEEFSKELTGPGLIKHLDSAYTSSVRAEIPLLSLQQRFDLAGHLKKLNVTNIFNDKGDFSKMFDNGKAYVSAMMHVAYIDYKIVPLEGNTLKVKKEPHRFVADRPFMFAVVEQKTMSLVILGRYFG